MQSASAFFVSAPRDWEKSRSRLMNSRALLMPVCLQGAWVIKLRPVFFIYATRQRGRFIVIVQWLLISRSMWSTSCKNVHWCFSCKIKFFFFLGCDEQCHWRKMHGWNCFEKREVTGTKCPLQKRKWQILHCLMITNEASSNPAHRQLTSAYYAGNIKETIKNPDWGKHTKSFNYASAVI